MSEQVPPALSPLRASHSPPLRRGLPSTSTPPTKTSSNRALLAMGVGSISKDAAANPGPKKSEPSVRPPEGTNRCHRKSEGNLSHERLASTPARKFAFADTATKSRLPNQKSAR